MKDAISYSNARASDYPTILALNAQAVPDVNLIDTDKLAHLHQQAVALIAARDPKDADVVAGFLLALDESASYESVNYRYFQQHYPEFVYVDRIVVDPDYKRQGIGRSFYARLFELAGSKPVTCEVNLLPANPDSLAFHTRLGFRQVGEQNTEAGSKRVALLVREP